MRIAKVMRFTVRVREYETIQVEVAADASHYDLGLDDSELAHLSERRGQEVRENLKRMVEAEVRTLARAELQSVTQWSEIHPNLADDYLDHQPANMPRSQHASKKTRPPASASRGLRRGTGRTPSSSSYD